MRALSSFPAAMYSEISRRAFSANSAAQQQKYKIIHSASKQGHLMFHHNFGKSKQIYKMLSP